MSLIIQSLEILEFEITCSGLIKYGHPLRCQNIIVHIELIIKHIFQNFILIEIWVQQINKHQYLIL